MENVLVWYCGDDAIDTDQSFAGSLRDFIAIDPRGKALELDGPEGSYQGTGHTISNGFVYLNGAAGAYDDDEDTDAIVSNIYFTRFSDFSCSFDNLCSFSTDYHENGIFKASNLQMDNHYLNENGEMIPITVAKYFADMAGKVDENGDPVIIAIEPGTQTVGPLNSTGYEWTWAYQSGKLAEIGLD